MMTTCLDCGQLVRKQHKGRNARCRQCARARDAYFNAAPQRLAYRDPAYRAIPLVGKCAECGSTRDLTRDHITSLAGGGGNEATNIRILCRRCNSSKGRKSLAEFAPVN